MADQNRRAFLADVSRGMLVASLGSVVAADLELAPAWAGEGAESLTFGKMEPLVALMRQAQHRLRGKPPAAEGVPGITISCGDLQALQAVSGDGKSDDHANNSAREQGAYRGNGEEGHEEAR